MGLHHLPDPTSIPISKTKNLHLLFQFIKSPIGKAMVLQPLLKLSSHGSKQRMLCKKSSGVSLTLVVIQMILRLQSFHKIWVANCYRFQCDGFGAMVCIGGFVGNCQARTL